MEALFEVGSGFEAADVLHEVKVAVGVNASIDKSVPVDALQFDVGVVLLEREVKRFTEVNVWALDRMHVFFRHLKLRELEVLWEHLHFNKFINYYYLSQIINL